MADTLSLISTISFIACIAFSALAVVLFFVFKIPDVVGELSGRKLRRSIQKQRGANEKSGNHSYRPSRVNEKRDKLTEKIQTQGSVPPEKKTEYVGTGAPPKGETADPDKTESLYGTEIGGEETVSLYETAGLAEETTSLEETASLENETMQLGEETISLNGATEHMNCVTAGQSPPGAVALEMIEEVILVHSDEIAK